MRSYNRRKGRDARPLVVLLKGYDTTRWFLERFDSFPKNQRFVFGQRLAEHATAVLKLLVEAPYSSDKTELLHRANQQIEVLRWLVCLAKGRKQHDNRQEIRREEERREMRESARNWKS